MSVECPHCHEAIHLNVAAEVPPSQKLVFRIDRAGDTLMSATTVAGFVSGTDKLLKAVAKDIGAKVHVFIERVEWSADAIAFHFVIVNVKNGAMAKMTAADVDRLKGL